MTYQKIIKVLGLPDGSVRQSSAEKNKIFFVLYLTHPHVLRHTFCSRLCESDMNVKVIQEIMGHKNVETTLDIYTEVNYNKKKDSLEELASKMQFF